MPAVIGTVAEVVDTTRLATSMMCFACPAAALGQYRAVAMLFPMIFVTLEHLACLQARESQAWPAWMSSKELDLAKEMEHSTLFKQTFRIRVECFVPIFRALGVPNFLWTRGERPAKFSGVTGLLVLLARLGSRGAGRVVGRMLRMNPKRVSAICVRMVRWLCAKWSHVITDGLLPSRLPMYAEAIRKSSGIATLDIFCFIDCTVRGCCRPLYGQEAIYGGHKKIHGLKYQALAFPDGILGCLYGPRECRAHDLTCLADSALLARVEALQVKDQREWLIYGDPAYTPGQALMTGFSRAERATDDGKEWLSKSLNADRTSVEWSFGRVNALFPFVDDPMANKVLLSPVALFYESAVFLTNCITCVEGGNIHYSRFHVRPPTLEEYLSAGRK